MFSCNFCGPSCLLRTGPGGFGNLKGTETQSHEGWTSRIERHHVGGRRGPTMPNGGAFSLGAFGRGPLIGGPTLSRAFLNPLSRRRLQIDVNQLFWVATSRRSHHQSKQRPGTRLAGRSHSGGLTRREFCCYSLDCSLIAAPCTEYCGISIRCRGLFLSGSQAMPMTASSSSAISHQPSAP